MIASNQYTTYRFSLHYRQTCALIKMYTDWTGYLFRKEPKGAERDAVTGKIIPLDTGMIYRRRAVDTSKTGPIEAEIQRLYALIADVKTDPRHSQRKKALYEEKHSPYLRGIMAHREELSGIRAEILKAEWEPIDRQRHAEQLKESLSVACYICHSPAHKKRNCPDNPLNGGQGRGGVGQVVRGGLGAGRGGDGGDGRGRGGNNVRGGRGGHVGGGHGGARGGRGRAGGGVGGDGRGRGGNNIPGARGGYGGDGRGGDGGGGRGRGGNDIAGERGNRGGGRGNTNGREQRGARGGSDAATLADAY